jgi:pimeloyl-ACP methyl ester carboxylesterase
MISRFTYSARRSLLAATLALAALPAVTPDALADPWDPPSSGASATLDFSPQPGGPDLIFKRCPENASLDCGAITVPIDYAHPSGASVRVAAVRARALDPSQRIGTLFVHPGRHDSGVDFVLAAAASSAFQRLRRHFDMVSIDPRGVGRSRALDCDLDLPTDMGDSSDAALQAFFDERSRLIAAQCLDREPDFVRSISGNNFARDIETLRRGLREEQLSFVMISNSGPVGAVYASMFPQRVRAMLIDSTVGPDFADYNLERPTEQSVADEFALARVDQICLRTPGCPLRAAGVVDTFDLVQKRLQDEPFVLPNGSVLTASGFAAAVDVALGRENTWPLAIGAIANAAAGNFGPFAQPPAVTPSGDGFTARFCNDYGTRRAAADYQPIVEATGSTYRRFFPVGLVAVEMSRCMAWPRADTPFIRNVADHLRTPILLIGAEFDTETPFAWTKRMAQVLGMSDSVLRFTGGGHTLSSRSDLPCVASAIDNYLRDLKLPARGSVCSAAAASPVSGDVRSADDAAWLHPGA